jgi:molybdopterin synthase sulfur carrier subunit
MAQIWIPSLLRDLTDGNDLVNVEGQTVGDCLVNLDVVYPGIRRRLCDGNNLTSTLNVAIDGKISRRGLKARVKVDSDIHFVPAIAGG